MAPDPEQHPAAQRLRDHAAARRASTAPPELHPATRELLLGEVRRTYPKATPEVRRSSAWRWLVAGPAFALVLAGFFLAQHLVRESRPRTLSHLEAAKPNPATPTVLLEPERRDAPAAPQSAATAVTPEAEAGSPPPPSLDLGAFANAPHPAAPSAPQQGPPQPPPATAAKLGEESIALGRGAGMSSGFASRASEATAAKTDSPSDSDTPTARFRDRAEGAETPDELKRTLAGATSGTIPPPVAAPARTAPAEPTTGTFASEPAKVPLLPKGSLFFADSVSTEGGSRRFQQLERRKPASDAAPGILRQFTLARTNGEIVIRDADGTLYRGPVLSGQKNKRDSADAAPGIPFRATGRSARLQRDVVIEGSLLEPEAPADSQAEKGEVGSSFRASVRIGEDAPFTIEATTQAP